MLDALYIGCIADSRLINMQHLLSDTIQCTLYRIKLQLIHVQTVNNGVSHGDSESCQEKCLIDLSGPRFATL